MAPRKEERLAFGDNKIYDLVLMVKKNLSRLKVVLLVTSCFPESIIDFSMKLKLY